ncbi:MAG: hypothetical protein DMG88_21295 [Acidobacteria bacterium]|nr:MAG: hypothetical protein DMG88_21295 [Acidobacteriota bacterium]
MKLTHILILTLLAGAASGQVQLYPAANHDLGETAAHFKETEPSVQHCAPLPTEKEKKKQAKEEAKRKKLLGDEYDSLSAIKSRWELLPQAEKCAASQAVLTSGTGEVRLTFFHTYVFDNSRLVEIRFTDIAALTRRYGKPVNTISQNLQNPFAGMFVQRSAIWDLPQGAQAVAAESFRWDDCFGSCPETSTNVVIRTAERVGEQQNTDVKF